MTVFVDPSAIIAHLDPRDPRQPQAEAALDRLLASEELLTHSFATAETVAVLQSRFGMDAVRGYVLDIEPVLEVVWVAERTYRRAVAVVRTEDSRNISLVDRISFEVMRELGIDTAFTLDHDFEAEGFRVVP